MIRPNAARSAPGDPELTHLQLGTNVRSNERYPALASHRSGRLIHAVRRAKPARRPSRLLYPKTAAQKLHLSRFVLKNQNPQNGHLVARFDWGLGAICFGASPLAAVFGSVPGSATSPEHRLYLKPTQLTHPAKPDISTWRRLGHFYLALTVVNGKRLTLTVGGVESVLPSIVALCIVKS